MLLLRPVLQLIALIARVKGFMLFICVLFSATVFAEGTREGNLVSFEDSSRVTLIHIVRSQYVERWLGLVLPTLLAENKLPDELFRTGKFGGVFVSVVPRIENIGDLTPEEILKNSFFSGLSGAKKDMLENSIMMVLNPREGAIWLSDQKQEEQYKKLNWRWYANPFNYLKQNKFQGEFLDIIKKNWRMPFRHSGIYEENNIIGHAHHLSARSEGPRMLTAVVTNPQQIDETRVIIPASVSLTGRRLDFMRSDERLPELKSPTNRFPEKSNSTACNKIAN